MTRIRLAVRKRIPAVVKKTNIAAVDMTTADVKTSIAAVDMTIAKIKNKLQKPPDLLKVRWLFVCFIV